MTNDLSSKINSLVEKYGETSVRRTLDGLTELASESTCTIIINKGIHSFPDSLLVGEVYIFSDTSVPMESGLAIERWIVTRIKKLKKFLMKKKWSKVYLLISGHAAVCMQVKLAVYRVTHIETIDLAFDGKGNYLPVSIPMRKILTSVE